MAMGREREVDEPELPAAPPLQRASERSANGATRLDGAEDAAPAEFSVRRVLRLLGWVFAVAGVLVVAASVGWGWGWTGFSENGSLWAWFSLLVLPVALAVLPIWLKTRRRYPYLW